MPLSRSRAMVPPTCSVKMATSFKPRVLRAVHIEVGGDSNAIVGDLEDDVAASRSQGDFDAPLSAIRKGVLERIGHQLIDDQPARIAASTARGMSSGRVSRVIPSSGFTPWPWQTGVSRARRCSRRSRSGERSRD